MLKTPSFAIVSSIYRPLSHYFVNCLFPKCKDDLFFNFLSVGSSLSMVRISLSLKVFPVVKRQKHTI